jgi:uncharacterized Tic20 family protein
MSVNTNEKITASSERNTMETPPLTAVPQAPKGSDKIWSMLSHLSAILGVGFVLPLVVYLAMRKESEYVAANAREALNFHISVLIYVVCCIPLVFIVVGIPLLILIGLGSLVLAIMATVKASNGLCYRYPLTLRLVP